MSALFDFQSFLTVVLLTICTCTYFKLSYPSALQQKTGWVAPRCSERAAANPSCSLLLRCTRRRRFKGLFWKAARIGGAPRCLPPLMCWPTCVSGMPTLPPNGGWLELRRQQPT
jgi:hypothetical protein